MHLKKKSLILFITNISIHTVGSSTVQCYIVRTMYIGVQFDTVLGSIPCAGEQ